LQVQVRGRNVEVTSALKDYVDKRLSKLVRYLDGISEALVTLTVEKGSHCVEVTIPINGMILRGEETTQDMYASVDLVVEKLEKQIRKFKGKLLKRLGKAGGEYSKETAPLGEQLNEDGQRVVRNKRFNIKPMSLDEAILQMNLLSHSFYVFTNADTEQVNVLYRRKDGNYGLIEPEV